MKHTMALGRQLGRQLGWRRGYGGFVSVLYGRCAGAPIVHCTFLSFTVRKEILESIFELRWFFLLL